MATRLEVRQLEQWDLVGQSPAGKKVGTEVKDIIGIRH
jgi:hypothetical protein